MFWSATAVAADLCTALNGLARKPVPSTVDGFNYDFFADVSKWISTPDCDSSKTSVDWTSDDVDVPSLVYSSNGVYGKGGKVKYHVKGSFASDSFSVSASVTVQMTVSRGSLSNPITATFGFDVQNIPSDLSGRFAPIWQGSLTTSASSGLGVYDDDLFDGAGPLVITDCSASYSPSSDTITEFTSIARLVGDVSQRFRNFEAVPTALSGDVSARLAFPPASIISTLTSSDFHPNGTGFVAHAHGECRGADCGEDASRTLLKLAGADTVCQSPSLVSGTLYGSTHATMSLVGSNDVSILGVRSTIQAVFSCSSQGYIGVSMDTIADPDTTIENKFSLQLFLKDTRAGIAQAKVIPMIVRGRRCGYVTGSSIMTPVETDMFGHGRGGAFVDDVVISDSVTSQFQSAVSDIQNLINSKYPAVNDVYSTMFSTSATADIVTRYFAQVAHPTSYGLWSFWAEQFNGFAVARDANDNQLLLEINSYIHSQYPYEASDPSVAAMNSVMSTVHAAVKGACGDACSSLTTEPTLSSDCITNSKLTIAISATVQIPTMSLSSNLELANNARRMIKLIPRKGAIHGPEDVHMEFIAYVDAAVGAQGSTLGEVELMFSSVFDKATMIKGSLVSTVTGVSQPVGMGINGDPFFNSNVDSSALSSFASSFTSASVQVSSKEGMTLMSLVQLNDRANSETVSQLLSRLASSLPTSGSMTIMDYFKQVRDFLEGEIENAGVIPFLSLDYDSGMITFDLTFMSVRRIGFEASGVSWSKNIPISRTELTLQLSTRVSFTVNSVATLNFFEISGYSRAQDFALPTRHGMRVGLATTGYCETVVNIPSYSYVVVSFSGAMERGNSFTGVFSGNMSMPDSSTPVDQLFSFTMTEENRGDYSQEADPAATLAAFGDHFMFPSYIAGHQLSNSIAPLNKPLSEIIDFESSWRDKTAWVFSTEAFPYVFVASVSFPFSGFSETVNITVNDDNHFVGCQFNIGSVSTINDLVSAMTGAVAQCGTLSQFVDVTYTQGDDSDFSLVMIPKYAGSLYNFIVTAPEGSQSLMQSQSWAASRVTPDHLSWNDLYDGVYLAILKPTSGYSYSEPQFTTVNVAEANLVDSSRAKFYPTELPTVFFPASWNFHNPPKKVDIDPEFDSDTDGVEVEVSASTAYLEGDVSVSMVFGMSLWCSLGDGGLPMSTSFTSEDGRRWDQVTVPAAPDNTFTFIATAEKRSASSVSSVPPLESWTQTITLTPGKLLVDALVEEVPGQLTGLGANMITVERHQDSAFPDNIQALLEIQPYQPDSDTLYVPLEFTLYPTNLVAFGSPSSYTQMKAMTSCALTKDYKLNVDIHSAESSGDALSMGFGDSVDCSGAVGVAEMSKCGAKLNVQQSFSVSSVNSISLLGDMHNVIGDKDRFPDWYNSLATVSSVLTVNNIAFNVSTNTMSDLQSEVISLKKSASVPFGKLKESLPTYFSADISTDKPTGRALKSLSTTNKKTFCSGLKMTLEKVKNYAACDSMNQIIPFTDQHLAPIYTTLINEKIEDSMDSVCDVTNINVNTLSDFCGDLSDRFGIDVCRGTALSDEGLDIPMFMSPGTVFAPVAFQFDTERLTNADLSTGFGNAGDLLLETNVSANVGMKFVFLERNSNDNQTEYYAAPELDASKTVFTSRAAVDSRPTVRTSLGSTIVNFNANNLNVDIGVTGSMSENSDDIDIDLDGSASFDAQTQNDDSTYTCHLNAKVPVLQHYFHRPANAWEDTVEFTDSCLQGTFVSSVGDSMEDMTIAHYFEQDPSLFFKQFNNGLGKDLFNYLLDFVTDQAIAFLGKNINAVVSKALDTIVGPAVASEIGNEITEMVYNVIKSGQVPNATDVERIILQTITGILNEVFEDYLTQTINTPQPGGDNYTWEFRFGTTTVKEMKGIDWSCGDHGYADLAIAVQPQLTLDWTADFDIVWSKKKGISIKWPIKPAFSGSIRLDGSNLELSGGLLFLAAELTGSAQASGKLSISPSPWDIEFNIAASLSAQGKLGLVSKIRQETKGDKKNALGALPYVSAGLEASWQFNWGTQNPKPTTPASFKFTNPQLCLGSLIAEFMQQITREVNRIIKPLDPVFGPDGILMKPIPGISKILGDHCNVLTILEWTCKMFSSSCNVDTIRKLINVLTEIANDIKKIKDFMQLFNDPQGCFDYGYIYKTFKVDWLKDNPTPEDPETNGDIPMTPQEHFNDNIPESQRSALRDLMQKWSPAGAGVIRSDCINCTHLNATFGSGSGWGFKLDILENFPIKLISLLLGSNIPLMSVSFPEASMSYSITWTIPVWPTPYVAVNIHAGATLTFRPPAIALMSDGIIDTVRTGNPSYLFRNLAVCTNTSFATGTLELDGGAEGGISVIIAKVTVNFDITIKFIIEAKVANFGSGDWITFDSILMQVHNYGFNGAIHFRLELRGGFRLYLQGCVNLFFYKHCWTIVSWSWDTTLWSWEPNTPVIDAVCTDSGQINSDTVDFTYKADEPSDLIGEYNGFVSLRENGRPTYIITADTVMLMPYDINDGAAALTHKVTGSSITWTGRSTCARAYEVVINGDLSRSVTLPSCNQLYATIKQKGYRYVDQYSISDTGVVPNGHPQISYSDLNSLTLSDPMYGTKYVVSSTPSFPVTLDTDFGSVVNLTGSAYNYKGQLTITGNVKTLYWTVYCDNVQIGTTTITCQSMTVNIPQTVNVIKVASSGSDSVYNRLSLQPVNITITDTPVNRAVEIMGATSLVSVSVPAMKNMQGVVSVVGNSNDNNYMHVEMDTPVDNDIIAVAYPTHLAYNDSDGNDTHVLTHANVNTRDYSMKGTTGRKSTLRLIPPESYEKVTINMHGALNSELRGEIDGCDRGSGVNVNMYSEGTHTLVLGTNGQLNNVHCDLNVGTDGLKNDETAIREIVINASLDERTLVYNFNEDHFMVSDAANSNDFFRVYTSGLSRVSVHFSQVSASELCVNKFTKDGTEYAFLFPEDSENAGLTSVRIPETHSPILLNGPVLNVVLGDEHGAVNPLGQIDAVVVAPSGSNIMLNSMFTVNTSHISINENCISDKRSATVPKPSDWFISMMTSLGIDYKDNCNILVPKSSNTDDGFSTTVDITTTSGADTLDVINPVVDVVANMGSGDDVVNWMAPESNSRLFLRMGDGADTLIVQSAGPVSVDFGSDDSEDMLNVVCKDVSPNIHDSSIFPIGVRSNSRLEISNWDEMDTVKITRSDVEMPGERASAEISPNIKGANIIYQMNHNTDYSVQKCLSGTSLAFTSSNLGPNRALNTDVKVSLTSYDANCKVAVEGALNTNGAAMLAFNPKSSQGLPPKINVADGAVKFGELNMTLSEVDSFGIDIPATYFVEKGSLLVSGTPANKEMFINLPSFSTHIESNLKDVVVMTTFGESVTFDDLNENNNVMLISLSNPENPLTVEMGTSSMKELNMVNGCVKSSKTRTLSDWMLNQAKNAGFTLSAEQSCSAVFMGIEFLKLTGSSVETVHASGLNWNTLRSLILPASVENVILEEENTVTPDSLWTGVTIRDYEFIPTMNNDAFHVRMMGPKGTLTVASPVFAPSATISVECSDTSMHHVWNVALPDDGKDFVNSTRYIYSDVNFTTNGAACSGRINSRVFSNMNTAPSVSFGKGITPSVLIKTSSPDNATAVARHVTMTRSIDGMNEFKMESFDKQLREAYIKWDDDYTADMKVHLGDRSENVIHLGANVTNKSPLYLSASVHSGLSFPNLGDHTVSFEGVKPAHFNVASHSFDLLGGLDATSNIFCFSACEMCSADTWNQIRAYDTVCSVEAATTSACAAKATIHVSQSEVPALLSVSCSQPAWDPSTDGQCAVSFNANGADEKAANVIPVASEVIAGILSVSSAVATVVCASVLLSRILVAVAKVNLPDANKWWLSNLMRDFYNDQFSWSSIVLTACIGGITDFDISNWNGSVVGLILEVKNILFGWINICGSAYSPVAIISWFLACAAVTLRILSGVAGTKDSMGWKRASRFIEPIHAILSSISLLLLPLAGYAAGVVMSVNAFVGVVTVLAGICIIASIPVAKFSHMTIVRNIASYIAVSLPFLMSIISGAGASRGVILSFTIICCIVLPLCNTFVLWKLYFAGGDSRTKQWKSSLFTAFGLRAASLISGLIFISTLFFNLSETASGFSYAFWFLWVFLPVVQLIPLVVNTKYSNAIPRWDSKSAYASINGETTPLRSSAVEGDSSLRAVGSVPEEKAMAEVSSA